MSKIICFSCVNYFLRLLLNSLFHMSIFVPVPCCFDFKNIVQDLISFIMMSVGLFSSFKTYLFIYYHFYVSIWMLRIVKDIWKTSLKGRVVEHKRKRYRKRPSACFASHIATWARAGLGQSQEWAVASPSPSWVEGAKGLGPPCFFGTWSGSWIGSKAAGTRTG